MESIGYHNLLYKLNFLNHVLKYYGWVDQGAVLMTSINQKSRKIWNENIKAFSEVIFSDNNYFRSIQGNSQNKQLSFLLEGRKYRYFKLNFSISTDEVLKNLKNFVAEIVKKDENSELLFKNITEISFIPLRFNNKDIVKKYNWIVNKLPDKSVIKTDIYSMTDHTPKKKHDQFTYDYASTQSYIYGSGTIKHLGVYTVGSLNSIENIEKIDKVETHDSNDKNEISFDMFEENSDKKCVKSVKNIKYTFTTTDDEINLYPQFSRFVSLFPNIDTIDFHFQSDFNISCLNKIIKGILEDCRSSNVINLSFAYKRVSQSSNYTTLDLVDPSLKCGSYSIRCKRAETIIVDNNFDFIDKNTLSITKLHSIKLFGIKHIEEIKQDKKDSDSEGEDTDSKKVKQTIVLGLPNSAGMSSSATGVRIKRYIRGRGFKEQTSSIKTSFEDLATEQETTTNNRRVEYIFGTMKYDQLELKTEMQNLNNTGSIEVYYNGSPKATYEEIKGVLDSIFTKRITLLAINLTFGKVDSIEHLIEGVKANKTLKELKLTYMKQSLTETILEMIKDHPTLKMIEIKAPIKKNDLSDGLIQSYMLHYPKQLIYYDKQTPKLGYETKYEISISPKY